MLNALWHSVLPETYLGNLVGSRRTAFYGAYFQHRWYAVAIWTDPIAANRLKDGEKIMELRRLAIAPDAPRNTASRMLGVMRRLLMKKYPDVIRLISYQSVEHHTGSIYRAAGWESTAKSKFTVWHEGDPKDNSRRVSQITSEKVRWQIELKRKETF